MTATLSVGDVQVAPGEFGTGAIPGVELTTGDRVDIPVLALNGAQDGPTALLFSTQHGNEIQGIPVVHEVVRERVDAEALHGAIVGVPVGNPLAYMHGTYRSWVDNRDVGGVGAESPEGNLTERLAAALWTEAWSQADLVLNYHCTRHATPLQHLIVEPTPETEADVARGCRAFGVTTVRREDRMGDTVGADGGTTLKAKAAAAGIPHWVVEFGSGRSMDDENRRVGVDGTLDVLRELDLLDGEPSDGPQDGVKVVPCEYTGGSGFNRPLGPRTDPRISAWLRADHGGLLVPQVEPGDPLAAGDVVAEVVDLHGEVVEQVTMPADGFVGAFGGAQAFATGGMQTVEEGGQVASLFQHDDE